MSWNSDRVLSWLNVQKMQWLNPHRVWRLQDMFFSTPTLLHAKKNRKSKNVQNLVWQNWVAIGYTKCCYICSTISLSALRLQHLEAAKELVFLWGNGGRQMLFQRRKARHKVIFRNLILCKNYEDITSSKTISPGFRKKSSMFSY